MGNLSRQMTLKPLGGEAGDLFEGSRFGEEVGGAWHDGELLGTAKQGEGLPVQFEDVQVGAAHDEECRGRDLGQFVAREVGAAPS